MTRRVFLAAVIAILALAAVLRFVWLTSDPPTAASVGVVWHDEGAWVHNARNHVLWGVWRTDNWNPMFLAPVFTALEAVSFHLAGVGTWQARVVPALSGLIAIASLIAGLAAISGRRTALLGGILLATNYVFVMWNRAALMESTMTAFIVVSWAAYALAETRPRWAFVAGATATLAFFTKASAAFFVAGLGIEIAYVLVASLRPTATPGDIDRPRSRTTALWAAIGFGVFAGIIFVAFVVPHWSEYHFYNWQMSVARKPEYSVRALTMRASWLPLVQDFFTWMWPLFVAACVAIVRIASDWRRARPAERLLVLWVVVGLVELIVHDSGNERRYVMLLPALIALGASLLAGGSPIRTRLAAPAGSSARFVGSLLTLCLGYLAAGSAMRLVFLGQVRTGHFHETVLIASLLAAIVSGATMLCWRSVANWLALGRVPTAVVVVAVGITLGVDLTHLAQWARSRQTLNYEASVVLGRLLPPGTLVHGKLANGLSLENQIRPIFIGHDFGNYADRLERDDVRYILTYVAPSIGYESQAGSDMIQEILNHYPHHRTVATFAVNETGGPDRAALIEKASGTDSRAPD